MKKNGLSSPQNYLLEVNFLFVQKSLCSAYRVSRHINPVASRKYSRHRWEKLWILLATTERKGNYLIFLLENQENIFETELWLILESTWKIFVSLLRSVRQSPFHLSMNFLTNYSGGNIFISLVQTKQFNYFNI